ANLYLEQVSYGNKTPYVRFQDAYPHAADYLFRTVFDYGEYDADPPYGKTREWDYRSDAFSDYKAGFEIRTTRICRRVLLCHHCAGVRAGSALVRSLDFQSATASDAADFSLLRAARSHGYIKQPDGNYTKRSLPPIEFDYRKPEWN